MKVILSPAKSLNENPTYNGIELTQPGFQEESERLMKKLSKLSKKKIGTLMKISPALAELNHERYQNWSIPFTKDNAIPAGFAFSGAVYQGMDFASLSHDEQEIGQKKVRILSGLHGVLKPFDLIQPYRLEMGTRLDITSKIKNLYQFWGDKIRLSLEHELAEEQSKFIVNAASNEYFKAAQLDKMKIPVITVVFKDIAKDGSYKVNMQFAKIARGLMARYVMQENVEEIEALKGFDLSGYYFDPKSSSENEFIYLRDKR